LLDLQGQRGPFIGKATRARAGIRIGGFFGGTQPLSSLSAAVLYRQHCCIPYKKALGRNFTQVAKK
jgi:hypothetical protein